MPLYREHILPRLVHLTMSAKEVTRQRREALAGVTGEVLELGIGSGLNLPHYGPGVRRVVGVDPSATAARMAAPQIRAAGFALRGLETFYAAGPRPWSFLYRGVAQVA